MHSVLVMLLALSGVNAQAADDQANDPGLPVAPAPVIPGPAALDQGAPAVDPGLAPIVPAHLGPARPTCGCSSCTSCTKPACTSCPSCTSAPAPTCGCETPTCTCKVARARPCKECGCEKECRCKKERCKVCQTGCETPCSTCQTGCQTGDCANGQCGGCQDGSCGDGYGGAGRVSMAAKLQQHRIAKPPHGGWYGMMPQTCYNPPYGCYAGTRFENRYPAFHGTYYRRPYNYRNTFDYPWHAEMHEPTSMFSYNTEPKNVVGAPLPAHAQTQPVRPPLAARPVSTSYPRFMQR